MLFKPVDEISLRHLFSTEFAEKILNSKYLGPVLTPAGNIESSPDALVLDMRNSPFTKKRCEFKFNPTGPKDFIHNGKFEMAIIWSLNRIDKIILQEELFHQNDCLEIIVLSEIKAFNDLQAYNLQTLSQVGSPDDIMNALISRDKYSVYTLYFAAKLFPANIDLKKFTAFLSNNFQDFKEMKYQRKANVVSAFIQTEPQLLYRMYSHFYRWTNKLDSEIAAIKLAQLILTNFDLPLPSDEEINSVK